MDRKKYPTDLSDKEWSVIESLLQVSYAQGGRPPRYGKREILNAIFYILRTECQWRYLPHDLPPWKTVYTHFRNWKKANIFEKMNCTLTKALRKDIERDEEPSACIADSQSVKTTEKGGLKVMMAGRKLKEGNVI